MTLTSLLRTAALVAAGLMAACTPFDPDNLPPLGDFRLGHNVVLAKDVQKGPFSRDATPEELTTALADAVERRLVGYDGDGLYHLGISIGGYVLAQTGVPVVYTPKSVMIFEVTVFDNDTGERLNEEPFRITAFEGLENTSIVGSGLVRTKEEQLANLANDGARQLHQWLIEHSDWFTPDPDQVRTEFDRAAWKARLAETLAQQNGQAGASGSIPAPQVAAPAASGGTGTVGGAVIEAAGGGAVSTLSFPQVSN